MLQLKQKSSPHIALSSFLLIVLIVSQFLFFLDRQWERPLGGDKRGRFNDEFSYFKKAINLLNGTLPKAGSQQKDILEGKIVGSYSDYRPLGYPVFIALCNLADFKNTENKLKAIRIRTAVVQFFLIALLLLIFHALASRLLTKSAQAYLVAFILGIQPWAFEFSGRLLPDSVTAFLITSGLIGLTIFIVSNKRKIVFFSLLCSCLFLCLAFMMRPEMIVFVMPFVFLAIILKTRNLKMIAKFSFYSGLIFVIFVGINIMHQTYVQGRPAIVAKFIHASPGVHRWTKTWFNTANLQLHMEWHFKSGEIEFEELPERAFSDDLEKKEIYRAFQLFKERKIYDKEIDNIFQKIADKRIKENPLVNDILPRMWRACHLWLNLETNTEVLINYVPGFFIRPINGFLLLLKLCIYLLALSCGITLIRHIRCHAFFWYDYMALLMLLFVLTRTVFIGMLYNDAEHRLVLVAWPAMLWCAIYGFNAGNLKIGKDCIKK